MDEPGAGVNPLLGAGDGKILVLGASGQLGRSILERLAATGRSAIALCRRPPSDIAFGAQWLAHDLDEPLDLTSLRPMAAIHATGAWLLPAHLASLRTAGVRRLICFSSTSLLAKADSTSAAEREVAGRLAAAEAAVAACEIPWTVLRPTLIYGRGLDRNVSAAARFIRRWRFFPLAGPGLGMRQPVHADDLAEAAVRLIDDRANLRRSFNLGGSENLAYRTMCIFSPTAYKAKGEEGLGSNIIGTGPFIQTEYAKGEYARFIADLFHKTAHRLGLNASMGSDEDEPATTFRRKRPQLSLFAETGTE